MIHIVFGHGYKIFMSPEKMGLKTGGKIMYQTFIPFYDNLKKPQGQ